MELRDFTILEQWIESYLDTMTFEFVELDGKHGVFMLLQEATRVTLDFAVDSKWQRS